MKYKGIEITRTVDPGYVKCGSWVASSVWWTIYVDTEHQRSFNRLRAAKTQIDFDLAMEI